MFKTFKIIILFMLIFLVGTVQAANWDNVKSYDEEEKKITIYNWNVIGQIFNLKLAEYTLTANTDQCLTDCYAEGTATLYEEEKLFDNLKFKDKQNKDKTLKKSTILIEEEVSKFITVNDYEECLISEPCDNLKIIGTHQEEKITYEWVEYKNKKLEPGTYKWRIEGKKKPRDSVDWIGTAYGKEFTEWDWWNSNWGRKKQINVQENAGVSPTEFQVKLNVTYESTMNVDFSDIRFVNSSELNEIDYWMEEKTNGESATFWVKMEQMTANQNSTIFMYYNNSVAVAKNRGTTGTATFLGYADNSTVADWTCTAPGGSGTLAVTDVQDYIYVNGNDGDADECVNSEYAFDNAETFGGTGNAVLEFVVKYDDSAKPSRSQIGIPDYTSPRQMRIRMDESQGFAYWSGSFFNLPGTTAFDTFFKFRLALTVNDKTNLTIYNETGTFIQENLTLAVASGTVNWINQTGIGVNAGGEDVNISFKHIFFRQYVTNLTEATAFFGAEQVFGESIISLNNPPDNSGFTAKNVSFNCSVGIAQPSVIENVSLYIDGLRNLTVTDGIDNFTELTADYNFVDGNYNWTCDAVDDSNSRTFAAANFTFDIDSVVPEINITFPENKSYSELITRINITFIEDNPDSCWYSNNSGVINSTGQSCLTNFTDLTYGQGSFTITTYINDTANNQNFSNSITFNVDSLIPQINITTPQNYTNTTNFNIDVNYTFTEANPDSCWWTENRGGTNNSLASCGTNITSKVWSEGDHTVIVYINDTVNSVNSSSVFFTTDTQITNNTINKLGNVNYHVKDTNLTINWTVEDPFIDTCILEYSGVNNTLPCSRNYTEINITSNVNKTVILFVNDTLGNVNSSSMTWDYYIFEHSLDFNNETLEGSTEPFSLNITKQSSLTISAINLNYNNTNNLAVFTGTDDILAQRDITVPNVVNTTEITFYWEILLSNSTIIRSLNNTQQINNISIDDCSTFPTLIYNYTLLDEEEQTVLSGDELEVEIDLEILSFDRSLTILNISTAINGTNPVQICTSLPLNSTSYKTDTTLKYTDLGYAIEYYNIANFTLNNQTIPVNINLFSLNSSDSTEFQLTFTGSDFLPVENALVYVNRQYIAEGTFKTVELPKTDSNGQTILHLVRNDIIYNIIITKGGAVLGTFENLIAFCEDFSIGNCKINLNALSSVENIYDVDEDLGIIFTNPTYNETSRKLSFSYVSDDGSSKIVIMDVTRNDVFGNRSVCNDTLISAAGTLSCTVGANIEDSTLRTRIFVDGEEIVVTSVKIDKSNYGAAGYLVFFVMAISFILMFSTSKTGVLFGIGLSFLAAVGLGLITGSVIGLGAAGGWLILILVLAMWKLNKERVQ